MLATKEYAHFLVLAALLAAGTLFAQDAPVKAGQTLIDGPPTPADFSKWFTGMKQGRVEQLKRIGYDGAEFDRPELRWTQEQPTCSRR